MLGDIYSFESRLITFDLDQGEPRMPSSVAFQVLISIQNLVIHRCIINEGESTYVILAFVWKKIRSPTLQPSSTALHCYDVHAAQPQGVFTNVPIELANKTMLIYIEVVNAQLDYNLLLGCSYMYAM